MNMKELAMDNEYVFNKRYRNESKTETPRLTKMHSSDKNVGHLKSGGNVKYSEFQDVKVRKLGIKFVWLYYFLL